MNVTLCDFTGTLHCSGYGAVGYDSYVNAPGDIDELNTYLRPLGDLGDRTQLIDPLPKPYYRGQEKNFAWSNGRLSDTNPVCGTTYSRAGSAVIKQPYDGEIFCIETDGLASTIWRFAHNRGIWDKEYYWMLPFGNISLDGRWFAYTSSWDEQLGNDPDGNPRTDIWIVHLD